MITMKPVVKSLQKLFEHSDKNVREEVGIHETFTITCILMPVGGLRISSAIRSLPSNLV